MHSRLKTIWVFKKALTQSFLMLSMLRFVLWCVPYRVVRKLIYRTSLKPSRSLRGGREAEAYQWEMVWAIQVAGRYVLGTKPCLPQALAVVWFLRRKGIHSNLNIGVKRDLDHGISAHAWVEKGGVVIVGGDLSPVYFKRLQTVNSQGI